MMQSYHLEFILHVIGTSIQTVRSSLEEFGENLEIVDCQDDSGSSGQDFKICINAQDPTLIFDLCSQFGRIKSAKIDEEGKKP